MLNYTLDMRTVTPHFPGIGRYVRNLGTHLVPKLRETESLTLLQNRDMAGKPLPFDSGNSHVDTIYASASPFSLTQQWSVPRLLHAHQQAQRSKKLYHSSYYVMPYAVPYPTVLTIYDMISMTHPATVSIQARTLFRFATALALRASACVITISDATRRDLLTHFDVEPKSVITVHLAAEAAFHPRPVDEQRKVRNVRQLHDEYFLYLGSNKPHKNLVRLIDAYATLRAGSTGLPDPLPLLVIAGAWDKRYPEPVTRTAAHGLGDSVRFLGPLHESELPALYSGATAFLYPSLYEGFGLPVLEAMACGTPVACSHSSSLPEVAGAAAYYFDAYDTGSIAQAMRALVADSTLRRTLADAGLHQAQRFSWKHTASETLDIYRSLASAGSNP